MPTCPIEGVIEVEERPQERILKPDQTEVQDPEANNHELEAKATSPMPIREASVHHSEASLIGDMQILKHVGQGPE